MATLIHVAGDTCTAVLRATNITALTDLEFISSNFKGAPDEQRVIAIQMATDNGNREVTMRVKLQSALFSEKTLTGQDQLIEEPGVTTSGQHQQEELAGIGR